MSRGTRVRLGIVMMLAGMLASGAFVQTALAQDESGSPEDERVVFTWGDTAEPTSLNPMVGYTGLDFYFWTPSYHMLLDYDIDFGTQELGAIESGLVTAIEFSDDLTHFEYTIRDDLVWSDGVPLTAEDAAFTINLYKSNHAYLPSGYLTLIDGEVRLKDENTIEFDTKEPAGLYTGQNPYMYFYIIPKHVFEDIEKPKQFENVPSVGSGPFFIEEYKIGQFVRMLKNPEWTGPEPAIDEIIYRIYKNDDALATALTTGEIDFAYIDTPNIFNQLGDEENIDTMVGTIPSFSEIGFNTGSAYQEADGAFTPHGDGHPALTDKNVRAAMRMAINSQELVDKVLLGYGVAGRLDHPPGVRSGLEMGTGGGRGNRVGPGRREAAARGRGLRRQRRGRRPGDAGGLAGPRPAPRVPLLRAEQRLDVGRQRDLHLGMARRYRDRDRGDRRQQSGRLGDIINEGTYDMFCWGWYPRPGPGRRACPISPVTSDRRTARPTATTTRTTATRSTTGCTRNSSASRTRTTRWEIVHEMQQIYYEDAALRRPLVRPDLLRVAKRSVGGLRRPAAAAG